MKAPPWAPEPPGQMLPARTVHVPGRGEFFLRDSGEPAGAGSLKSSAGAELSGRGKTVMLLHGWMASADLNWGVLYDDLVRAGYRVLAIDHRGHGRGLRPLAPFRLIDCAADAAGVLRTLGTTPALVVGYSMGGAIAQLIALEHPEVVEGVVLSGTAQHWQDRRTRWAFRGLGMMGLSWKLAPRFTWAGGLRPLRRRDPRNAVWVESELMRHSARDIAEAGRELGRFDSRPWLGSVPVPIAVLMTTRDELVPPRKQRQLAAAAGGPVFETPLRHLEIGWRREEYSPKLLAALESITRSEQARAA